MQAEKLFENSAIRKFSSSADQQLWTQLWVNRCMCAKRKADLYTEQGKPIIGLTCEGRIETVICCILLTHVQHLPPEWVACHVDLAAPTNQMLCDILQFEKNTLQKVTPHCTRLDSAMGQKLSPVATATMYGDVSWFAVEGEGSAI